MTTIDRTPTDMAFGLVTAHLRGDGEAVAHMVQGLLEGHSRTAMVGAVGMMAIVVSNLLKEFVEDPQATWATVMPDFIRDIDAAFGEDP